ncbi:hypothetical protein SAY86_007013 [Trapa natans]|uniref:Dirigent protein n=1 Tax=Trapa natans TaxID=22666 RepID=A0AAN7LE64_TRANT|nr:hypothetical protein SAY86_007013 [Trapa natans]
MLATLFSFLLPLEGSVMTNTIFTHKFLLKLTPDMALCSCQRMLAALISSLFLILAASETSLPFSRSLSPHQVGISPGNEKLTHLHFYFHDIVSGPNMTAVRVAGPTAEGSRRSQTEFGTVFVIDDQLTAGPEHGSVQVGRAQGVYGMASQQEVGLVMAVNFCFDVKEYNGSCLSLLGRNRVFSDVREMPIVGGSGAFRFARGYAQARTHEITAEEATVEYNVFIYHYR